MNLDCYPIITQYSNWYLEYKKRKEIIEKWDEREKKIKNKKGIQMAHDKG